MYQIKRLPKRGITAIPEESRAVYVKEYTRFIEWKNLKEIELTTEDVLVRYFKELSAIKAPTTLNSACSRLKACLACYENINIDEFLALKLFLKRKEKGYKTHQATTLTINDIKTFAVNAPDEKFLVHKVTIH